MNTKAKPLVDAWHIAMVAENRCLTGIGRFTLTTHLLHVPLWSYHYSHPTSNIKIRPRSNINDPYSQISKYLQMLLYLLVILISTTTYCGEYGHSLTTDRDIQASIVCDSGNTISQKGAASLPCKFLQLCWRTLPSSLQKPSLAPHLFPNANTPSLILHTVSRSMEEY